jgi:hypothetical protein
MLKSAFAWLAFAVAVLAVLLGFGMAIGWAVGTGDNDCSDLPKFRYDNGSAPMRCYEGKP